MWLQCGCSAVAILVSAVAGTPTASAAWVQYEPPPPIKITQLFSLMFFYLLILNHRNPVHSFCPIFHYIKLVHYNIKILVDLHKLHNACTCEKKEKGTYLFVLTHT